jgi:D-alanine-D-alanine ligase
MKIAVLHNSISPAERPEDLDVLVQRDAVMQALTGLGHQATSLSATLDLELLRSNLMDHSPDVVFNLVEALGGTDRLMALVPLLLDASGLKYTGCPAESILASGNKISAKQRMRSLGLPTADWYLADSPPSCAAQFIPGPYILKPIFEHASHGIHDASIVEAKDLQQLLQAVASLSNTLGTPHFAEQYIHGREFNLSLLSAGQVPAVLPHAEILFVDYPEGKPHIVGYEAKWQPESFEYFNTPRRFDFPAADEPLLNRLAALSLQCWNAFACCGYARVDFRVSAEGHPLVLEVNANPCLAPDAGFAAALERAGTPYATAIEGIVDVAVLLACSKNFPRSGPIFLLKTPSRQQFRQNSCAVAVTLRFHPQPVYDCQPRIAQGCIFGQDNMLTKLQSGTSTS